MLVNDVILFFHKESGSNLILTEYVMYLIGYAPLFMLGLRLRYSESKLRLQYLYFAIVTLIIGIFIYKLLHGFPITLSPQYKYPPQSYYLVYGAVLSILLWFGKSLIGKIISLCRISSIAIFIGQNTIWIYLWHIPFVLLAGQFIENWILRYVIIYGLSSLIFMIQYYVVIKIDNKTITKYLIG